MNDPITQFNPTKFADLRRQWWITHPLGELTICSKHGTVFDWAEGTIGEPCNQCVLECTTTL